MAYAKLKKNSGRTLRSRGYVLKKDIWTEVRDEDIKYFATIYGDRVEFAPDKIIPQNVSTNKEVNGIISIDSDGKDSTVFTKRQTEGLIDDEEESEIEEVVRKLRDKHRKKRERKIKEKEDSKKAKKEIEKLEKAKERLKNKKNEKNKDITNPIYYKKKYGNKVFT